MHAIALIGKVKQITTNETKLCMIFSEISCGMISNLTDPTGKSANSAFISFTGSKFTYKSIGEAINMCRFVFSNAQLNNCGKKK